MVYVAIGGKNRETILSDATSASKKSYSSFADPNYHHSINVMNSCPHDATETKRFCVAIEALFLCKFIKYMNDITNRLVRMKVWSLQIHIISSIRNLTRYDI